MASLKYRVRGKGGLANIWLRLSVSEQSYQKKTGFIIDPKKWSISKGMPNAKDVDSQNLKTELHEMLLFLEREFNKSIKFGDMIDGDWLENGIRLFTNNAPDVGILNNFIEDMIVNAGDRRNGKGGVGLSINRIKTYKSFQLMMDRFEEGIEIHRIDLKFAMKFKKWQEKQGYSHNYITKNLNNLKLFVKEGGSEKLKDLKTYRMKKENEEILFLSSGEQEQIANASLTTDGLINARKWLLLSCLLGQRGGDLLQLSADKIKLVGDVYIAEIVQQKTGKQVMVPILPQAMELIKDGFPYQISLPKYNQHIKRICEIAEINTPVIGLKRQGRGMGSLKGTYPKHEIISSHVGRRSFATNFYGKIPTPVLIGVTGHGTEEMFLRYIGKSSMDNAMQMAEYFGKL